MAVTITIKGTDETRAAFTGVIDGLDDIGKAANQANGQTAGFFSGMLQSAAGFLAANVIGAITTSIGDAVGSVFSFASDSRQAIADLQTQLGITRQEAEQWGGLAQEIFVNNWGNSIDDVNASIIEVQQQFRGLGGIGREETQTLVQGAIALRDGFGGETTEYISAARTLIEQFGISGQEALDFITSGMQSGMNASGDFLDTIGEYSTQFANAGADAGQFFSVLETGLGSGVLGTDKAADLFKEFTLRITDGSKTTAQALEGIGLSASFVADQINSGAMTKAEVFQMVIDRLRDMDDAVARDQLAVNLLGTQYEDLGLGAALAIDSANTKLEDLSGATSDLNVQYDNLGKVWEGVKRGTLDALQPIGDALLDLANKIMPLVSAGFEKVKPIIANVAEALANGLGRVIDWMARVALPVLTSAWNALQPAIAAAGTILQAVWSIYIEIDQAAAGWGANIVTQLAGGITSASSSVVSALGYIGQIISYWLRPNSPPRITPDLDVWGEQSATLYAQAWAKPENFSALREIGDIIDSMLSGLVSTGALAELDRIPFLQSIQTGLAQAIDEIDKQGEVLADTWDKLAGQLDQVDPNLRDAVEAYFELAEATKDANTAQAQLDDITQRYTDRLDDLKKQIDDVNKAFDERTAPIDAELEAIDAQQDALDLEQARQRLAEMRASGDADAAEIRQQELRVQRMELEAQKKAIEAQRDTAIDAIEQQIDATEQARDAESAAAQEQLNAAKERQSVAQEAYNTEKSRIDQINEQNGLIAEQARLIKAAADAAASGGGAGGGLGGLGGLALPPPSDAQAGAEGAGDTGPAPSAPIITAMGGDDWARANEQAQATVGVLDRILESANKLIPVQTILDTFSGMLQKSGEIISTYLMPPIEALGTKLVQGFGNLSSSGESFHNMLDSLLPALSLLGEIGLTLSSAVFGALIATVGSMLPGAFMALDGVLNVIFGTVELVSNLIVGVITQISQVLSGDFAGAAETSRKLLNDLAQGIFQIFGGLVETVLGLIGSLISGVVGFFSYLYDILVGHSIVPDMVNAILQWFGSLATQAIAFVTGLVDSAIDLFGTFASTIGETIGTFVSDAITSITQFKDDSLTFFGELYDKAVEVVDTMLKEIDEIISDLKEVFGDALDDAIDLVTGYIQDFVDIGRDFAMGIADGFERSRQAVIDAVWGSINGVIRWVKEQLGIASPSKVSADEIGLPFMQGIALGIERGEAALYNAVHTVGENLQKEIDKMGEMLQDTLDGIFEDQLNANVGLVDVELGNEQALASIQGDAAKRLQSAQRELDSLSQQQQAIYNQLQDDSLSDTERQQLQNDLDELNTEWATLKTEAIGLTNIRDQRANLAFQTRQQLEQARQEADQLGQIDPEAAEKLYATRSKYITDLAQMRADKIEADNTGEGVVAERLRKQIALTEQKYEAEMARLNYQINQEGKFADLIEQVAITNQAYGQQSLNDPDSMRQGIEFRNAVGQFANFVERLQQLNLGNYSVTINTKQTEQIVQSIMQLAAMNPST